MRLAKSLCPLLCLPLIAAGADSGPLGISSVDTADLRLLYADPSLSFLVPHTARTFSNALDWQRRIFGWTPSERTTVMLPARLVCSAAARCSPLRARVSA